jgi:8-oxo-dGTP pyrophosphatase MutT (NUDIX family)
VSLAERPFDADPAVMTSDAVQIRPAATILLVRDDPTFEVLMVKRHHQIDFASGALVFPGGKVDPQDSDARVISRLAGYDAATPGQSELRAAAIREAFEESGILLARRRHDGAGSVGGGLRPVRQAPQRGA